jgi:antitoxin Phd
MSMRSWPVQDAKARFSELLDTCLKEGPQIVTRRGADAAVLVPMTDWQRLQGAARPTLKDLLLSDDARGDLNIPRRGARRRREPSAVG